MNGKHISFCTSIFASGETHPTSEQYTNVFIKLVNQLERSKESCGRPLIGAAAPNVNTLGAAYFIWRDERESSHLLPPVRRGPKQAV